MLELKPPLRMQRKYRLPLQLLERPTWDMKCVSEFEHFWVAEWCYKFIYMSYINIYYISILCKYIYKYILIYNVTSSRGAGTAWFTLRILLLLLLLLLLFLLPKHDSSCAGIKKVFQRHGLMSIQISFCYQRTSDQIIFSCQMNLKITLDFQSFLDFAISNKRFGLIFPQFKMLSIIKGTISCNNRFNSQK